MDGEVVVAVEQSAPALDRSMREDRAAIERPLARDGGRVVNTRDVAGNAGLIADGGHPVPLQLAVVSLPSSPHRLSPQHCTEPPVNSAQTCQSPPANAMAALTPGTVTGTELPGLALPSPNWRPESSPQHFTLPFPKRAQANDELAAPWPPEFQVPPAVTATAPRMPVTGMATGELARVPLPSWPWSFAPQHQTLSSTRMAQAMSVPALIAVAPRAPQADETSSTPHTRNVTPRIDRTLSLHGRIAQPIARALRRRLTWRFFGHSGRGRLAASEKEEHVGHQDVERRNLGLIGSKREVHRIDGVLAQAVIDGRL
jgi:hypothetical protein